MCMAGGNIKVTAAVSSSSFNGFVITEVRIREAQAHDNTGWGN